MAGQNLRQCILITKFYILFFQRSIIMIKNALIFLLCLVLCHTAVFSASAAETNTPKSVMQSASQDYVFEDGLMRICQTDNKVTICVDQYEKPSVTAGDSVSAISAYAAESFCIDRRTQTITTYIFTDGKTAQNSYADIALSMDEISTNSIQYAVKALNGTDHAYCATFSMKINYTKETVDGETFYDITTITGGFSDDTSRTNNYVGENVYVTALALDVGQTGAHLPSGRTYVPQTLYDYTLPVSRSWTFYPPTSWIPVQDAGLGSQVGATYYFTLSRGNSSWTDSLSIEILGTLNYEP